MTQIIGGHNLGLFDGSFTLLNRNDQTGRGTMGHGEQSYANVSNGNLIFQERDIFLPSTGADIDFVRTYNSRGTPTGAKGWFFSFNVTLDKHNDKPAAGGPDVTNYTVTYGDGTQLEFVFKGGNTWVSTDGAGSYETLQVIPGAKAADTTYLITRADRSKYLFDKDFTLLSITDANNVATTFGYKGNNVVTIKDGSGETLTLVYQGNNLLSVNDDASGQNKVLVQYVYTGDLLTQVIDRSGHVTKYHYNSDHLLDSITAPSDGTTQPRTTSFQYTKLHWDDHPHHPTAFDGGDEWALTQITDANGGITTFEYNFQFANGLAPNDRDVPFKDNNDRDFQGGTTRVVDALGNARAYSNDAQSVAWRIANGFYNRAGATNGLYVGNYDPKKDGAAIAAQNADAEKIRSGQAVTYTYDANGQLTKVKNELGFETSYTYDANGNLTSTTDNNGWGATNLNTLYWQSLRTQLGKNPDVNMLSTDDKNDLLARFTSHFVYDVNGNMTSSTDNAGNTTTYVYDLTTNNLTSMTTQMGHTTTFAYTGNNLILRTDALNNKVAFSYDGNGNLTQKIVYLVAGDTSDTSKQEITTYGYDGYGNNITVTTRMSDTKNITTSQVIDHFGNLSSSKDGRQMQTIFTYDADNRLTSMTDPQGHVTTYAYDAVGNQISVKDANNHTVTSVYDLDNMLLSTTDPSSDSSKTRTTKYTYDVLGDGTQVTDAENRTTTYVFDADRQLITIMSPTVKAGDGTTNATYQQTFAYDGEGNTITKTDRNGNTTKYLFTVNGQIWSITDAVGNRTDYVYDHDLRQMQITIGAQLTGADALKKRVLTFAYDDVDQLTSETDSVATAAGPTNKVRSYSYDGAGNVISVTDGYGNTTNFTFDLDNRLTQEMRPGSNPVTHVRYTITHEYDDSGNEITTTDEDGHQTTVAYDNDGRAVLVTDGATNKTVYQYDSRDNRTSIAIGVLSYHFDANNDVVIESSVGVHATSFGYDEFNQLISKTDGLSQTEYYAYDRVGNRTRVTDRMTRVTETLYDALDRAVSVTEAKGTGAQRITTFRYDGNGNVVETMSGSRETTTAYDRVDRVTDQKDAMGTVTHFELDSFGNVLTRYDGYNLGAAGWHKTMFEYDARGRMSKETDAAGTVTTFDYDLNDQLITRTTGFGIANFTPRVERFEYNVDGRLSAQVDGVGNRTVFEYDGVGNQTKVTVLKADLVTPLRWTSFEYDGDNRVKAEINNNGTERTEYRYDASGNKIEVIQAFGITGQERHTLMFYDADDRLTSVVDPIGWARANSTAAEFVAWRADPNHLYTGTLSDAQKSAIYDTQRTSYVYDNNGNQTTITEADGTVTTNTFDELGRLLTNIVGSNVTSPTYPHGGIKTTNTYDVFGNVLTSTKSWADGTDARITTYTYDKVDRQLSVTDGEGFETLFDYDVFGNQTRIQRGIWTGAANDPKKQLEHIYDTRLTYDAMDRLLTTADGRHNRVSNAYDVFGNRTSQISGQTTDNTDIEHLSTLTFKYDLAGHMIERRSASGVVKITYDEAGNQHTIETLQSGTVASDGTITNGIWTTQTLEYDGNGRVTASIDSLSARTEYHYDAVGNQTSIVFAAGTNLARTFAAEYDLDNNKTATLDAATSSSPSLNRTTFAYDAVGNVVKRTDALGAVTRFYYDAFGRVSAQLNARNYLTTFQRDSAGNLTQTVAYATVIAGTVADGSTPPTPSPDSVHDRITSNVFDLANRLTQQTAPDGSYKTWTFDSTGKELTETQYASTDTTLRNRTVNPTATRARSWQYDASGRISQFIDVDGTTETYTYDAANNKTSQTVHNPNPLIAGTTRYDPDRTTTFSYDGDNRLTTQLFDPDTTGANAHTGLKLQQTLAYDREGNVVSKTDANNHVTTTRYDLENRITRVTTGGLNTHVDIGYDLLGNKTSVTDALLRTTTLVYDKNNRLTQEIHPTVSVTTMAADGSLTVNLTATPTITTTYDAVGNIIQVADARGFKTSRWYDATGNMIAERAGDGGSIATTLNGTLRTFTYDAFGQLITVTQDTAFHSDAIAGQTQPPSVPVATARTVTNTYDKAGHVTITSYPAADITSVNYSTLVATTSANQQTSETNNYDAWGNLVQSIDRNGNSSYAYYDVKGRQIATVDAAGFMIQTDLDDLGHVVQQRKYKTAVTPSLTSLPTGTGTPATIDRFYDFAGRLIDEISPAVHTGTNQETRVDTHFAYDAVGNMISKTLGYATSVNGGTLTTNNANPRTEYYFYDAANRRVLVVDSARVASQFGYDANGNLTSQKRFFNKVDGSITLGTASLDTINTSLAAHLSAGNDQETDYAYDSSNHVITRTDLMGTGATDDIINASAYDEAGNLTWRQDAGGSVTKSLYDFAGHVIETVAPNNSFTFITYNTGGLKTTAYTGGSATGTALHADFQSASVGNSASAPLVVTWDQAGGAGVTSWAVWGTSSQSASTAPSANPGDRGTYMNASGGVGHGTGLSVAIPITNGQTIYFRIMTKDGAGNLAWTEERSVSAPPRISSMVLGKDSNGFVLTVNFDTTVDSANLFLQNGATALDAGASSNSNRTYTFNFTGTASQMFHIAWHINSGNKDYATDDFKLLAAAGAHVDSGNGWVQWPLPGDAATIGNGQYILVGGQLVLDKSYIGNTAVSQTDAAITRTLQLNWKPAVTNGHSINYDVLYGNIVTDTHSATIAYQQHQTASYTEASHTDDGQTPPHTTSTTWNATYSNAQMVVNLSVDLSSTERGNVDADGVQFALRTAQGGLGGFGTPVKDASGNASTGHYAGALNVSASTDYEIKIFYIDKNTHKEVIVEWRHVTAPGNASTASNGTTRPAQVTTSGTAMPSTYNQLADVGSSSSFTSDHSLQELGASETGGTVAADSNGHLTVTAGTYQGPVNPDISSLTLTSSVTHNDGNTQHANGLIDKTYYTRIEYNALGAKIASNEDSGVWRRYAVDGNGNQVETFLWGTEAADTTGSGYAAVTTFKRFDARDLQTGDYGALPVTGGTRAVTTKTYDYDSRVITEIDPGNTSSNQRSFTYDDVGNMVSSTDAEGQTHATTMSYNIFGQLMTTTNNGHTRSRSYNADGLLAIEGYNDFTSSDHRYYMYDAFGRRTQLMVGDGTDVTTRTFTWDQHDRMVTSSDELTHTTHYYYDKRDNQTWIQDANGHWFGKVYDGMDQVTDTYAFTGTPTLANGLPTVSTSDTTLIHETTEYDLFGNRVTETDAAGHHQYFSYGAFGQLISQSTDGLPSNPATDAISASLGVDAAAVVTTFTYDRFGNKTGETSNHGKSISYAYDDAGRLTQITDTGTRPSTTTFMSQTVYTYDAAGDRTGETLTQNLNGTTSTWSSITYTYDHDGWMTSWKDTTHSIGETLTYDAAGNVTRVVGDKSGTNAYFQHNYTYDAANRVTQISSGAGGSPTVTDTYQYDKRGRRSQWVDNGTTVNYTYDEADRLSAAGGLHWLYDSVGNVTAVYDSTSLSFTNPNNSNISVGARASDRHYTIYHYDGNNFNFYTESNKDSGYQTTTTAADKSGRTSSTVVVDASDTSDQKTYTYTYTYNADGTEAAVSAGGSGDVAGNSRDTYDVNRNLVFVDLGKGDKDHNESKTFIYDNAGQIVQAVHDDGQAGADHTTTTKYEYALDTPAGQYVTADSPTLDEGNYSVLKAPVGAYPSDAAPDFPTISPTQHVVQAGETLQSIASQVYGHPELWFVIADANGLTGSEHLQAGQLLTVPNSVQYAGFNSDTHTIYQQGDIVGSKLPNLKSPPPASPSKCAIIAAIILIVVVAIIAIAVTVLTVGAAAPAAAAALGVTATSAAGIIVGVAVGAVIGAAIAFTASVITQGILIGFKLQDSFDWKAVAADTVAGAFSGAAVGLGSIVRVAETATTMLRIVDVVGQTALQVGGEATRQVVISGHVDDWTGVALAGVGGALGSLGSAAERDRKVAQEVVSVEGKLAKLNAAAKLAEQEAAAAAKGADAAQRGRKTGRAGGGRGRQAPIGCRGRRIRKGNRKRECNWAEDRWRP